MAETYAVITINNGRKRTTKATLKAKKMGRFGNISEACVQTICAVALGRIDDVALYGAKVKDPDEKKCIQRVVSALEELQTKKKPIDISHPKS